MDQALWKGRLVSAFLISKDYQQEKEIRETSKRKELMCPDPECGHPVLKYCHGDIKNAYFSHVQNTDCLYDRMEKQTSASVKDACYRLADLLSQKGFKVTLMTRVSKDHVAHLVLTDEKGRHAIEFITTKMGVNRLNELKALYEGLDLSLQMIVISDVVDLSAEDEVAFAKRYVLHEEDHILVFSHLSEEREGLQAALDNRDYRVIFPPSERIYSERHRLEDMTVVEGRVSACGFDQRFKAEQEKKQARADEIIRERAAERERVKAAMKAREEKEEREARERQARIEEERRRQSEKEEKAGAEAEQVQAAKEFVCIYCGLIGSEADFMIMGGEYGADQGVCRSAECQEEHQKAKRKKREEERLKLAEKGPGEEGGRTCPLCGGKLVARNGRTGKFMGCENYPRCHYTRNWGV